LWKWTTRLFKRASILWNSKIERKKLAYLSNHPLKHNKKSH
jgi:hypothetical protein